MPASWLGRGIVGRGVAGGGDQRGDVVLWALSAV